MKNPPSCFYLNGVIAGNAEGPERWCVTDARGKTISVMSARVKGGWFALNAKGTSDNGCFLWNSVFVWVRVF